MKRDANPEKGLEALDQCEYMVLAMTDGEGKPYCIPLNGVRVGEKIYFHCAKAGEKVDCLRTHPQVCLTAVGHQRVIQAIYETEYQCAVVRGTAGEVTDETEMREALWALCRKYSPDCLERVEQVIDDSFAGWPSGKSVLSPSAAAGGITAARADQRRVCGFYMPLPPRSLRE